jgi:hypothetical protein
MKAVVVIATWSSGSTAVTGYLDKCGCHTCPPHIHTSDRLTPNSFEPVQYRAALAALYDEFSLEQIGEPEKFVEFFEDWYPKQVVEATRRGCSHIVLKHPLQAFVLHYLDRKLSPFFLFVTRPLADIEATRMRRNWHPIYGLLGAQEIYQVALDFMVNSSRPVLSVPYALFKSDDDFRRKVLEFVEIEPTAFQLGEAESFVR